MTLLCTITVPGDVAKSSPNSMGGRHRFAIHRLEKQAMETARYCWIAAGRPRAKGKVRVGITVRRGRIMDIANIVSGAKGALDGIFKDGVTPDDSPRYLELGAVRQETGKRWKGKEEVSFAVYSLD